MKRILFALTIVGLLVPLVPRAQAQAEVSLNLFYDNLSPYGNWILAGDYGYCFQPNVAVSNSDWRPYSDGYWAYTDVGWTWVSYEDFGWATYHYGRWANLESYGWLWVPGYEWGPAWVSWRTGGDYVGWAPLPPQPRGGVVYEGRPITGAVDVSFGIGPLYYNFVDIRYIGAPVLRERIITPQRNVTIINRTVNVTNITYNNSTVINHGPDINRLDQYSTRPIQRLSLQRETNVNFSGRRGNFNRVNGNALVVAAPAVQRSQQQLAPKHVKARVEQPKVEKGWQGVNNRQQVEAEMKKENAQNVPPPTFQPQRGRKGEAAAGRGAGAQPNESPAAGANVQREQNAARRAGQGQREQNADQRGESAAQTGQNADQRKQNAGRAENANASQSAKPSAEQNAGERNAQRSGERQTQPAQRDQNAERKAQQQAEGTPDQRAGRTRADQNRQEQTASEERTRQADPNRSQERKQGNDRTDRTERTDRADQTQNADRPDRASRTRGADSQQTENTSRRNAQNRGDQADNAPRKQRAQESQRAERPQAQSAEQPDPQPRAQGKQQSRRQEQTSSPQSQNDQNPDGQRKKKKKQQEDDTPKP